MTAETMEQGSIPPHGVLLPVRLKEACRLVGVADLFAAAGPDAARHFLATLPSGTLLPGLSALQDGGARLWLRFRRGARLQPAQELDGAARWLDALGGPDAPGAVETWDTLNMETARRLRALGERLGTAPSGKEPPAGTEDGIAAAMDGFDALLRGRFRRPPDDRRMTPLAIEARRLAELLHLKPVPVAQNEEEPAEDFIERFAVVNRLRVRRIRTMAAAPHGEAALLAFGADGAPMVLMPALFGPLRRVDGTKHRRMLHADMAGLQPEMYAFYPLLPDGPLSYRAILLFGLRFGWEDLGLIGACALLGALLAMLPLAAAAQIARIGVHSRDLPFLGQIILVLLYALVAEALVLGVSQLAQLRFHGRAAVMLTAAMLDRMTQLPAAFLRGSTQAIIATQMEAVTKVRASGLGIVLTVSVALCHGLAAGVLIAASNPAAGLVAIVAVLGTGAGRGRRRVGAVPCHLRRRADGRGGPRVRL